MKGSVESHFETSQIKTWFAPKCTSKQGENKGLEMQATISEANIY